MRPPAPPFCAEKERGCNWKDRVADSPKVAEVRGLPAEPRGLEWKFWVVDRPSRRAEFAVGERPLTLGPARPRSVFSRAAWGAADSSPVASSDGAAASVALWAAESSSTSSVASSAGSEGEEGSGWPLVQEARSIS